MKQLFTLKHVLSLRLLAGFWMVACLLLSADMLLAQTENIEEQVKAAFLLKFVTYVEWPSEATATDDAAQVDPQPETRPLVLGVVGAEGMASILEQMAVVDSVNGRSIEVRRLQPGAPVDELDVLFVGQALTADASNLLMQALDASVLTVTEDQDAPADAGSVINFLIVDDRVAFDISLIAARQANLQLSSRLLQVAQRIFD